MKKNFFCASLLFFAGTFVSFGQDAVFNVMRDELNRNFEVLKNQPVPVYYGFVRLDEEQSISASAELGHLRSKALFNVPSRSLSAGLRVGDYTLDNSHEIRDAGWDGSPGIAIGTAYIPAEDNEYLLKTRIWLTLDELYKESIQTYEQVKANMAVKVEQEDKSADFSREPAGKNYEKPLSLADFNIDPQMLEEKVRKYSAVFDENDEILSGVAFISISLARKIFIDTEGREIAENTTNVQLYLGGDVLADDGMYLPLSRTWLGFSLDELPSDEEVLAAAREMSHTLSALRRAPVVESFTGPAILSPEAAGVFFHEIFGHRIEGSRLKREADAQTFKKKIGEQVLPKHLSVSFDPTLNYYQNTPLIGSYAFDDEGIAARKLDVVQKGILKNFLMSRTPIAGFDHSNGHGRGSIGNAPVARQSNLLVESTQRFSEEELIKKLRKEAKSQRKEYAYYFKDVSGGFTNTSRYSPNSFNITPLVVYRIYTDGRPNELVRGVNMVGTPLAMFSQIEACGDRYAVFNGFCGAESGSVPVACVAPALFVKQIETQKRPKNQTQPPLLSKPAVAASDTLLTGEEIIFKAIREEVTRGLNHLKMDGLQPPFFISYSITDSRELNVSASYGSLAHSNERQNRMSSARLLIGDYQCTDENFNGNVSGGGGFSTSPTLENDEKALRNSIWKELDEIYKDAAETYEQKIATIKQLNIPEKDLELPDWDKTPVVRMKDLPRQPIDFDRPKYEAYVKDVSAVFRECPDVLAARVSLVLFEAVIYFYNTEGTEFTYPFSFIYTVAHFMGKTADGEDLVHDFGNAYANPDELPPVEELSEQCRLAAGKLSELIRAPKMTESYSGPVLFEGEAASNVFEYNFFDDNISLVARRKPLNSDGFAYGGNKLEEMIGKRITAREITIEDLTGTPEHNGVRLLGYTPIDGQGVVPPARTVLVEDGILKTLLSDRVPTPKVPHSNGHARFGMGFRSVSPGVIRLTDKRMKSREELKRELFDRARQEGYEYAYIIRDAGSVCAYPNELYQVNIADGSEKRIRSAYINNMGSHIFKQVVAVSDTEFIFNPVGGLLQTVISPDAILFEDIEILSDRVDHFKKAPVVVQSGAAVQ
ncbi:MAG: hypothetical protein LBH61_03060 [Dysgonamonadaceae bacterium]|jgi:predicted Zn-dependent protease|nr:hypothetical protein [Dysgonamonadaceae bacterium]